jgi:putative oligomerization/nucleic acid binding protein
MFRRRRPLLRAAAVGGTAYVAGKHMERNAQERADAEADQNQRIADLEAQQGYQQQQPQYQQPPAAAPAAGPSMLDQLNQLTTLHEQGALTDEEFSAAKAKLLG